MYHYSEVKKIIEYFKTDSLLLDEYYKNPETFLQKNKINIDSDYLNEVITALKEKNYEIDNEFVKKEKEKKNKQEELLYIYKNEKITHEKFDDWRKRQIKRIEAENHKKVFNILPHVPVVYELSSGCSVGCSFCCFDPEPLKDNFEYNDQNRKLWIHILEINKELFGRLAGMGSCYFATEPFDNPDYEKFAYYYYKVNNWWPQLTTALHQKHVDRIKFYIRNIDEYYLDRSNIRFSISSKSAFNNLYQLYSEKDLENIELLFLNKESQTKLSPAGRIRKKNHRKDFNENRFYNPGPVACVSGFIINMATKTIKLISTTTPSDKYPLGYILFDESHFYNTMDYKNKILDIIEKNMFLFPPENSILSIGDEYLLKEDNNYIEFNTDYISRKLLYNDQISFLINLVRENQYTVDELKNKTNSPFLWENYYKKVIKQLFDFGIIRYTLIKYKKSKVNIKKTLLV